MAMLEVQGDMGDEVERLSWVGNMPMEECGQLSMRESWSTACRLKRKMY